MATNKETVHRLLAELGDAEGKDPMEFMNRASKLYYSNEDQIIEPSSQHIASPDRSVESDSDIANIVQNMKDASEYYFNNEEDVLAYFINEGSEKYIQCDSKASPQNIEILKKAEGIVLSEIKPKVEAFDVFISEELSIHTVCFKGESRSNKVPLVMIHGFGGCIPTFHKNYGQLTKDRCVYGIDLPGFALSTRVKFPNDAIGCENKMVDLIESWRKKMKIEKIILLGHSFGGYISGAYAIKHSSHVCHLVLLDPWGVLSKDEDNDHRQESMCEEMLAKFFGTFKANPFKAFQRLGPMMGHYFVRKFMKKTDREDYGDNCMGYFVQAIMMGKQTGAKAFSVLSNFTFIYPELPLKKRLIKLLKSVPLPVTFIYGKKSALQNKGGKDIQMESKTVTVKYIEGGSHHIHAQKPDEVVNIILDSVFTDHIQEQKTDEDVKIATKLQEVEGGKKIKRMTKNHDEDVKIATKLQEVEGGKKIKRDHRMTKNQGHLFYSARHLLLVFVAVLIIVVYTRLYM